jgi:hypothetical protein
MQIEIVTKAMLFQIAINLGMDKQILQFTTEKTIPITDISKAVVAGMPVMSSEWLINVNETINRVEDKDNHILLVSMPEIMTKPCLEINKSKICLLSVFLVASRESYEKEYVKQ